MNISDNLQYFKQLYNETGEKIIALKTAGRVNLIGEHTDYNSGYVLPCAINLGITAFARKRSDNTVKLHSTNFTENFTFDLKNSHFAKQQKWYDYPLGIIKYLYETNCITEGFEILFSSNLPLGAGLSSSAALLISTISVVKKLFDCEISEKDIVTISHKVENEFIGLNCGIMDQFAITFGKQNKAILLNCESLDYKYINTNFGNLRLVIINSNKQRKLSESKYNERRTECEKALLQINKTMAKPNLSNIGIDELDTVLQKVDNEQLIRRVKHIVEENHRTLEAAKALEQGNIATFATMLKESHISLRKNYEVTGFELDTLVEVAQNTDGCICARMTGAGFGGCTVNFVENSKLANFKQNVANNYFSLTGLIPTFYECEPSQGIIQIL